MYNECLYCVLGCSSRNWRRGGRRRGPISCTNWSASTRWQAPPLVIFPMCKAGRGAASPSSLQHNSGFWGLCRSGIECGKSLFIPYGCLLAKVLSNTPLWDGACLTTILNGSSEEMRLRERVACWSLTTGNFQFCSLLYCSRAVNESYTR